MVAPQLREPRRGRSSRAAWAWRRKAAKEAAPEPESEVVEAAPIDVPKKRGRAQEGGVRIGINPPSIIPLHGAITAVGLFGGRVGGGAPPTSLPRTPI